MNVQFFRADEETQAETHQVSREFLPRRKGDQGQFQPFAAGNCKKHLPKRMACSEQERQIIYEHLAPPVGESHLQVQTA